VNRDLHGELRALLWQSPQNPFWERFLLALLLFGLLVGFLFLKLGFVFFAAFVSHDVLLSV
jgi:hypothetical protein